MSTRNPRPFSTSGGNSVSASGNKKINESADGIKAHPNVYKAPTSRTTRPHSTLTSFRNSSSFPHSLNHIGLGPGVLDSRTGGQSQKNTTGTTTTSQAQRGVQNNVAIKSGQVSNNTVTSKPGGAGIQQPNIPFRKSTTMSQIGRSRTGDGTGTFALRHQQTAGHANIGNNSNNNDVVNMNNNNVEDFVEFDDTKRSTNISSSSTSVAAGFCFDYGNYSGGSSTSPNRSQEASSNSVNMRARCVAGLYKHIIGTDIPEQEMEETQRFLSSKQEAKKNVINETRLVERLKIHLIHQGKHKESKKFAELHQKLKVTPVLKHRDAVVDLLYNLFDKEATRAALAMRAAMKSSTKSPAAPNSPKQSLYDNNPVGDVQLRHPNRSEDFRPPSPSRDRNTAIYIDNESNILNANTYSRVERTLLSSGGVPGNVSPSLETGYWSTTRSPRTVDSTSQGSAQPSSTKNRLSRLTPFETEFDPTPFPKLQYSQDAKTREEIHNSQSKVPSLSNSVAMNGTSLNSEINNHLNIDMDSGRQVSKIIAFPKDYRTVDSRSHQAAMFPFCRQLSNQSQSRPVSRSNGSEYAGFNRPVSRSFGNSKLVEKELIRDLVYIFQGFNGSIIKCNSAGNYEIMTRQNVHPSIRLQTLRLCEVGFLYKKIRSYCDKPMTGLMVQGLKHACEQELREFYRLLAIIQAEIQQSTVDTPLSEDVGPKPGQGMTMLKLTVWMFDSRPRLEALAAMIESCENKKGGEMLSVLYRYSQHGDPMVSSLTNALLSIVAKPLYLLLCQWILYGELEDPHMEFFIAADSNCKKEHLWHSKYNIRKKMLPSFIPIKHAERILATGKNINFLKEICQNSKGYDGRSKIKNTLETSAVECMFVEEDQILNVAIQNAYNTTSEMVLNVLIEESRLLDHLKAIKHYLLLGQGDFIQYLLELIQDELSKPATKLFTHNLSAILEAAVRATNAQYENEDVLNRLDTRILPSSDKDLGWDVFCLDYKVQGPIGTVLTEDIMVRYNQLFNTLWRTKRIERILSTLWKNQTTLFKYQRTIPELGPVLHRSQLLISEMIHFVHQTQYYIMFEATECAWDRLMEDVSKSTDLDQVISAHNKFLDTITGRSLLDPQSRELLNQLRGIFDSVHELKIFLTDFADRATVELQGRKNLVPNSPDQREAQKLFFATYIIQAKGKIETLYTTTQDLVRSFLLVLNRQPDLTLQCLSFRLDFNEYYHLKDSRLSQPLTFQHRRLSSNSFMNMSTSASALSGMTQSVFASILIPEISESLV